ncbi:MAG: hypothetical protein ACT4P7_13130 [Gemmatimonadaceae bacterium]
MRAALLLACVISGIPSRAGAQKVATRALGKPLVELAEPFSGASEVRELADGRLVVLDVKDNALQLVSADFESLRPIGREGSGPTEYRRITQLLPRRGDSTLAYDVMNARFLVIDNKGAAASTISLRDASGGLPVGPMAVRGYDAAGRLYYQGMKLGMGPSGPTISDTSAILRLDPQAKKVDTLGLVRIGSPSMKMSGDAQKGTGAVRLSVPAYPVVDEWGLLPDGRVVVVRGADYRLEFITGPGVVKSVGPVAYERVKVTEADRAKMRETQKKMEEEISKAAASAASSMPATARGRARMPSMAMDMPTEWPDYKPAFGQAALKLAPNGELWISRHRAATTESPIYDVFTGAGALRFRVELPAKHALVGIGAKHLYVVRVDDDELQYLQRYVRP